MYKVISNVQYLCVYFEDGSSQYAHTSMLKLKYK